MLEIWKIIVIGISIVTGAVLPFVYKKFKIKHDNVVEEVAEEAIYEFTGVDMDLTPTSPEEKDGYAKRN